MQRIELLQRMMASDPDDPFLPYALGLEHIRLEAWETAARQLALTADRFPDYIPTYYQWGQVLEQLLRLEEARTIYSRGLEKAKAANEKKTAAELQEALWSVEDALD